MSSGTSLSINIKTATETSTRMTRPPFSNIGISKYHYNTRRAANNWIRNLRIPALPSSPCMPIAKMPSTFPLPHRALPLPLLCSYGSFFLRFLRSDFRAGRYDPANRHCKSCAGFEQMRMKPRESRIEVTPALLLTRGGFMAEPAGMRGQARKRILGHFWMPCSKCSP